MSEELSDQLDRELSKVADMALDRWRDGDREAAAMVVAAAVDKTGMTGVLTLGVQWGYRMHRHALGTELIPKYGRLVSVLKPPPAGEEPPPEAQWAADFLLSYMDLDNEDLIQSVCERLHQAGQDRYAGYAVAVVATVAKAMEMPEGYALLGYAITQKVEG